MQGFGLGNQLRLGVDEIIDGEDIGYAAVGVGLAIGHIASQDASGASQANPIKLALLQPRS
jgi:hypothetical protein